MVFPTSCVSMRTGCKVWRSGRSYACWGSRMGTLLAHGLAAFLVLGLARHPRRARRSSATACPPRGDVLSGDALRCRARAPRRHRARARPTSSRARASSSRVDPQCEQVRERPLPCNPAEHLQQRRKLGRNLANCETSASCAGGVACVSQCEQQYGQRRVPLRQSRRRASRSTGCRVHGARCWRIRAPCTARRATRGSRAPGCGNPACGGSSDCSGGSAPAAVTLSAPPTQRPRSAAGGTCAPACATDGRLRRLPARTTFGRTIASDGLSVQVCVSLSP